MHYGHLVPAGSTVGGIAEQFNTTESTLLNLNGMASSSQLLADSIIDVPLKGNIIPFFFIFVGFICFKFIIHCEYEFVNKILVLIDAYLLLILMIN